MFDYSLITNEIRVILLNLEIPPVIVQPNSKLHFFVHELSALDILWPLRGIFYSTSLLIRVVAAGCYSEFDHKHGENRICNGTNSRDFSKLDI